MCGKSAQIQSMSWTVDKTVYELKHEGEKLVFMLAGCISSR